MPVREREKGKRKSKKRWGGGAREKEEGTRKGVFLSAALKGARFKSFREKGKEGKKRREKKLPTRRSMPGGGEKEGGKGKCSLSLQQH